VHILFISIIFEAKTVILPFLSVWQLVVRCHFGVWPLGRVGFEATFSLIRPVLSFFYKLAEFLKKMLKIGVFKQ